MSDESTVYRQAADLIHGVMESLQSKSEYYQAHETIVNTEGLSQALVNICNFGKDNMEIAALSFKMGVYLGLQYRKLDDIWK